MNTGYRIYVEKKTAFQVEARSLKEELNENLSLHLTNLRLLNVYDLFGFTPELLERSRYSVFGEVVTDCVTDYVALDTEHSSESLDISDVKFIAVEYLPGQFDQRAASAVDCVHLIEPKADIRIKSSRLYILDNDVDDEAIAKIKQYVINPVESREKDLRVLCDAENVSVAPVEVLDGFIDMDDNKIASFCKEKGLAMNSDDLKEVIGYFKSEKRNPNETELRIIDTYWSDHCRHTTFTSELKSIGVEESFIKEDIDGTLELYMKMRQELGREKKPLCLMDDRCKISQGQWLS